MINPPAAVLLFVLCLLLLYIIASRIINAVVFLCFYWGLQEFLFFPTVLILLHINTTVYALV